MFIWVNLSFFYPWLLLFFLFWFSEVSYAVSRSRFHLSYVRFWLWTAYFPWKKILWVFFEAQEGNALLQEDLPLFFSLMPQGIRVWWLNSSLEVLDDPKGVNLGCKYVCGPACLYDLLGILVLFCNRKTNFLVVL